MKDFTSMEFYMFGAGMLFLGVLLGVVGIAVYKSQVIFASLDEENILPWNFWCDSLKCVNQVSSTEG